MENKCHSWHLSQDLFYVDFLKNIVDGNLAETSRLTIIHIRLKTVITVLVQNKVWYLLVQCLPFENTLSQFGPPPPPRTT